MPRAWKAFLDADVVIAVGNSLEPARDLRLSRPTCSPIKTLIHINISEMEIDKAYKADYALVSDAKPALRALIDALEPKVGPRPPATVDAPRLRGAPAPAASRRHSSRASSPRRIGRMLPPRGIVLADAGAHLAWLGYFLELADGQNFRKPGTFGPMAGHVNGAIGTEARAPRPGGGGGLRRRLLLACPASS